MSNAIYQLKFSMMPWNHFYPKYFEKSCSPSQQGDDFIDEIRGTYSLMNDPYTSKLV